MQSKISSNQWGNLQCHIPCSGLRYAKRIDSIVCTQSNARNCQHTPCVLPAEALLAPSQPPRTSDQAIPVKKLPPPNAAIRYTMSLRTKHAARQLVHTGTPTNHSPTAHKTAQEPHLCLLQPRCLLSLAFLLAFALGQHSQHSLALLRVKGGQVRLSLCNDTRSTSETRSTRCDYFV